MQDWEYEVSDPDRIDEFLEAYESGELTEDERFTLMETIIDSFCGSEFDKDPRWRRVLQLLDENIELHIRTVCYWSCLLDVEDSEIEIDLHAPVYADSESCFDTSPFIREVLEKHKHSFAKREYTIRRLLERYLNGPDPLAVKDTAKAHQILPVYADMGGTLFLRPNGEVLCLPDGSSSLQVETLSWRLVALVSAAKKYPELVFLLPA